MKYYRTKDGTKVYIASSKQFPPRDITIGSKTTRMHDDPPIDMVYRVKDGHALWGCNIEDLIPEEEWIQKNKGS